MPAARHEAEQHYEEWLRSLRIAGRARKTIESYESTIEDLLEAYPDTALEDFTPSDLELFLLNRYQRGSFGPRKSALKSFFSRLRKREVIVANPMDLVDVPTPPKRQREADLFTEAEIVALSGLPYPDGPLFRLMFDCGLWKRECLSLRRRDIHLERGYVTLRRPNGNRTPITEASRRAVEELDENGVLPEDHLWWTRPGGGAVIRRDQPISATRFQVWYGLCLESARVPYRKPDIVRQTTETRRRSGGAHAEDVAVLTLLLAKIKDEGARGYVEEAVTCLREGAMRAAVVFTWAGAIRTLHEEALGKGESALNGALKKQYQGSRTVAAIEDFGWIKDRTFLDACPDLGILDKGQKQTLIGWLDLRNNCGHPTNYQPGVKKVSAFIEDIISIVFP